ncbi:FadR/GntR family transcriptional regulator [Trujillonella humicola]|uniref:FadR/GntR family transcriptional regulator n=1 Tax=Trujillonella humicola TaxID=3383699 RepID=UPI0039064DA7
MSQPGPPHGGDRREPSPPRAPDAARGKVSDQVAHALVRDIAAGALEHRTELPHEAALIERFGVGRASVREALSVLEVLGVIAMRRGPQGGPVVLGSGSAGFARMTSLFLQLGHVDLTEVVVAWTTLGPVVVRLAAQRRGSRRLAALGVRLAGVPVEDDAAFRHAAEQLHGALSRAAGNPLVALLVDSLAQLVVDRLGRCLLPVDERAPWLRTAEALVAAVLAGRSAHAEQLAEGLQRRLAQQLGNRLPSLHQPVAWR